MQLQNQLLLMEKISYREGFPYALYHHDSFETVEMINRSRQFFEWMDNRRTVRDFSDKPIPREVIENIIKTASTAPSGAHKQPRTFCGGRCCA